MVHGGPISSVYEARSTRRGLHAAGRESPGVQLNFCETRTLSSSQPAGPLACRQEFARLQQVWQRLVQAWNAAKDDQARQQYEATQLFQVKERTVETDEVCHEQAAGLLTRLDIHSDMLSQCVSSAWHASADIQAANEHSLQDMGNA